MSKRIRRGEPIYLAPKMLGKMKDDGDLIVIDQKNKNEELDLTKIETKILVYEREVKGWFLDRAKNFLRSGDNDFIILMICMSYFEGVQQYIEGETSNRTEEREGQSGRMFRTAVNSVYQDSNFSEPNLKSLYRESRNGFFHNGMVRGKIVLDRSFYPALTFKEDCIEISPDKLLKDIREHFSNYINKLKDDDTKYDDLRDKFERTYNRNV